MLEFPLDLSRKLIFKSHDDSLSFFESSKSCPPHPPCISSPGRVLRPSEPAPFRPRPNRLWLPELQSFKLSWRQRARLASSKPQVACGSRRMMHGARGGQPAHPGRNHLQDSCEKAAESRGLTEVHIGLWICPWMVYAVNVLKPPTVFFFCMSHLSCPVSMPSLRKLTGRRF